MQVESRSRSRTWTSTTSTGRTSTGSSRAKPSASHIFFPVAQSASAPEKDQARAKATQALKELEGWRRLRGPREEVFSGCHRGAGRRPGFFGKEDLPPDFEAVAWGLKNGTTSGVVELGAGFHIIKVHERRAQNRAADGSARPGEGLPGPGTASDACHQLLEADQGQDQNRNPRLRRHWNLRI